MKIEHEHGLGIEEVYTRINNLLPSLEEKYKDLIQNSMSVWDENHERMDFSFEAYGFKISGNVQLYNDKIIFEGKLPLAAWPFKGKIENRIKENLESLLN